MRTEPKLRQANDPEKALAKKNEILRVLAIVLVFSSVFFFFFKIVF